MEDIQSVEEGLGKLGLRPEDIEIVILTQLHRDHIQLASKFVRAKFIVQKAELDFALNPHPLIAMEGSYQKAFFQNLNMEVIEGDREILDGVRVIFTPGHTPGGQSVVIETPKGTAVIPGFCCTNANFEPPPKARAKGFEVVVPARHYDLLQAYDSIVKVKNTGYIILPLHEPSLKDRDRLP